MELNMSQMADQVAGVVWIHCLQLTVVMLLVWAAVTFVARNRPHVAHVLWLLVVLKAITPPIVAAKVGIFSWIHVHRIVSFSGDPQLSNEGVASSPTHIGRGDDLANSRFISNDQESTHSPVGLSTGEQGASSTPRQADRGFPATRSAAATLMDPTITLLSLWCAGVVASFGISVLRVCRAIGQMKASRQPIPLDLQNRFNQQAKNAGVRARLWITSSNYGPVAFGVLWPTIVIPDVIVRARHSSNCCNELDSIISHELAHVRRRDLLIGWLQAIAQSLWWFHPLMWIANRRLSQESERCCDEEAVGRLGCDSAAYVRGLLNVLDVKRSLRAVPVLPGIRQLDITKKRLERIVKQKHRFRTRSPLWCGVLLVVGAAACLPGVAAPVNVQSAPENTGSFTLRRTMGPIDRQTPRQQIQLSVDLISGQDGSMDALVSEWKIKASERKTSPVTTVASGQAIRRDTPVLWTTVSESAYDKMRDAVQRESRLNVTSSVETVRVTQTLHLSDVVEHPFVVGLEAEPVVSTVDSGLTIGLTPNLVGEDDIRIHIKVELAKILAVERLTVNRSGQAAISVEVPKIATSNAEARFTVGLDDTLLVGGIQLLKSNDTDSESESENRSDAIMIAVKASIKPDLDGLDVSDKHDATSNTSGSGPQNVVKSANAIAGEPWDLTKAECLRMAMHQSKVARSILQIKDSPNGDAVEAIIRRDDITMVDAEITLRNLISEVEKTYWELEFFYRNLEAAKVGRDRALLTWRRVKSRFEEKDRRREDSDSVAQAKEQLFFFRDRVEEATRDLMKGERALRYLCGIPAADERMIRPVDKPSPARVQYDWESLLQRTLRDTPEIRRVRGQIERIEDKENSPETLTNEAGNRLERARARSIQLQMARAQAILNDTEIELSHSLTEAVQNVNASYQLANTAEMQELTARNQVGDLQTAFENEEVPLDFLLDAHRRHADALVAYHRSLTQFEMSQVEVSSRSGSLLADRNINLCSNLLKK